MPLGIKPIVDFAFKKIFGMETRTRALADAFEVHTVENKADLENRSLEELRSRMVELQEQLRSRGGFGTGGG